MCVRVNVPVFTSESIQSLPKPYRQQQKSNTLPLRLSLWVAWHEGAHVCVRVRVRVCVCVCVLLTATRALSQQWDIKPQRRLFTPAHQD